MKCPHCTIAFHEGWQTSSNLLQERPSGELWQIRALICPECGNFVAEFVKLLPGSDTVTLRAPAWPKHAIRPVPTEVEGRFADDFKEASATLAVSPKASAALSRRLLQDILREKAGVKKPSLDAEIQAVIDSKVPAWLSDNLDAVRVVGNFAAHPTKSTNTGEVVEVEPGEAEFLLDVLEDLFDFYFVLPERAQKQREGISKKLQDAGKPPLKS